MVSKNQIKSKSGKKPVSKKVSKKRSSSKPQQPKRQEILTEIKLENPSGRLKVEKLKSLANSLEEETDLSLKSMIKRNEERKKNSPRSESIPPETFMQRAGVDKILDQQNSSNDYLINLEDFDPEFVHLDDLDKVSSLYDETNNESLLDTIQRIEKELNETNQLSKESMPSLLEKIQKNKDVIESFEAEYAKRTAYLLLTEKKMNLEKIFFAKNDVNLVTDSIQQTVKEHLKAKREMALIQKIHNDVYSWFESVEITQADTDEIKKEMGEFLTNDFTNLFDHLMPPTSALKIQSNDSKGKIKRSQPHSRKTV